MALVVNPGSSLCSTRSSVSSTRRPAFRMPSISEADLSRIFGFCGWIFGRTCSSLPRQHRLNFLPLPHGQGSLRPTLIPLVGCFTRTCHLSAGLPHHPFPIGRLIACREQFPITNRAICQYYYNIRLSIPNFVRLSI